MCRRRDNHDLRHTGNTLAAATGASTPALMARMGHASPRAASIYRTPRGTVDAAIARALSDLIEPVARRPARPKVVAMADRTTPAGWQSRSGATAAGDAG